MIKKMADKMKFESVKYELKKKIDILQAELKTNKINFRNYGNKIQNHTTLLKEFEKAYALLENAEKDNLDIDELMAEEL